MPVDYQHFQVRVHRRWDETKDVLLKLGQISDHSVIFEHPPDEKVKRIHVHAYFFHLRLKDDAIRERIRKTGLKGNEDFAVSGQCGEDRRPLDLSGAWAYGTKKDALRPVWINNISPAIVEELQDYARRFHAKWDNISPAASAVTGAPAPKKNKNRYQHVQDIAANVLDPEFLKLDHVARIKRVRNATKEYLRNNQIFCGVIKTCEYIECVMANLDDETFDQAVNQRLNWVFFNQK